MRSPYVVSALGWEDPSCKLWRVPYPPVLVEIQAEQATADLRATLLSACSSAVEGAVCREQGEPQPGDEQYSALAVITWQTDGTVRIEVARDREQIWQTRLLRFAVDEEPAEVFTAVGFATGTLVGTVQAPIQEQPVPPAEAAGQDEAPPPPVPAAPPETPRAPVPPPPSRAPRQSRLGVWRIAPGVEMGSGRSLATARVGLLGQFAWVGPRDLVLGVTASYETYPGRGPVRYQWVTVGAGPGYDLRLSEAWGLGIGAEMSAHYFRAKATDAGTGLDDTEQRWVAAPRASVHLTWPRHAAEAVWIGAGIIWPLGLTSVRVQGVPRDDPAPFLVAAEAGVRFDHVVARRRR